MEIFVIYEGDQWLSTDSMRVKAVCSGLDEAVRLVRENNEVDPADVLSETEDGLPRDPELAAMEVADMLERDLREYRQTLMGNVRYILDVMNVNEWA